MRELVQHDVVTVEGVLAAAPARVPGEHDRAVLPRLAQAMRLLVGVVRILRKVRAGINENRAQRRVVGRLAVQQQEASLGGDRHADLVVHLQPSTPLESFLVEEHKDMFLQLPPIGGGQLPVTAKVRFQNGDPLRREGFSADSFATPFFEKAEHRRKPLFAWRKRPTLKS